MHPTKGYSLLSLTFKAEDQSQIQALMGKINRHLESVGFGTLPVEDIDSSLENLNLGQIRTLMELRPLMVELSLVHPKVELSSEFIQLKSLVDEKVKHYVSTAENIVYKLDQDFKRQYTKSLDELSRKAVNLSYQTDKKSKLSPDKLNQYLSFSEFKPLIDQVIGEQVPLKVIFGYQQDYNYTLNELFLAMKHKVMAAKANIPSLIDRFGLEIPVNEIRDSDPVAFEYLRSQAFNLVAQDYFSLTIPLDKTFDQRLVRPLDPLGVSLELTTSEIAIFAISVDPIRKFGLSKGQKMESSHHPDLKFIVQNDQVQMEIPKKIKVQVNEDTFVYVVTTVYYSYVVAELIKSQKTSSIQHVG